MSIASSIGLRPCLTDLDARVPRVTELGITSTSTVSEPRTTVTTTTAFPRFTNHATVVTYGDDDRPRRDCWYVYVSIGQRKNREKLSSHCLVMQLHVIIFTFAGIQAFRPHVISIFAATSSTVLKPSTARSAATDSS